MKPWFDLVSIATLAISLILVFRQMRLHKMAEKHLEQLAYHDALTGLVNRPLLEKKIEDNIAIAHRHGEKVAVLFIDLDNFKPINDNFGHHTGDFLLKIFAKRLFDSFRVTDTVGRLGGDEFVVILTGVHKKSDIEAALDKIHLALSKEMSFEGNKLFITASIGVAIYPENGKKAKTLIRSADMAMYQAKQKGGDAYRFS